MCRRQKVAVSGVSSTSPMMTTEKEKEGTQSLEVKPNPCDLERASLGKKKFSFVEGMMLHTLQ